MQSTAQLGAPPDGSMPGMSMPPDRPTERLHPHPPRQPIVEERIVTPAVDVTTVLVRLENAVNSVRSG